MNPTTFMLGGSSLLILLLYVPSDVTTSPTPVDYDNVRGLYEYLLQREAMTEPHIIVRKNSRSPTLRLRFGRRSDPLVYQAEREALLSEMLGDN